MKVQEPYRDQILSCSSPGATKRLARTLPGVPNWQSRVKLDAMWTGLCNKFTQAEFRDKLLSTGSEHLQEGNRWGDKFWGVDLRGESPEGLNVLGTMLMAIRNYLRNDIPLPERAPDEIVKKAGFPI